MQERYLKDCYEKEFESEVVEVKDDKFVVLKETLFYPNAGGQPNDLGTLECDGVSYNVVYVGKFSGNISHEVNKPGLKVGDKVKGKIDWDRRYLFMRCHTAAHLLSGLIHKKTGAQITGNQISEEKTRIDFNLPEYDREKIIGYVDDCNELIKSGMVVKKYFMSKEDSLKDPVLFRLKDYMPPELKEFRIVELVDFDKQACGGTHVNNVKEIGKLEFLKVDNKGKSNRRISFKVL
jgi:misacylated tRNA(Ala) deacylase